MLRFFGAAFKCWGPPSSKWDPLVGGWGSHFKGFGGLLHRNLPRPLRRRVFLCGYPSLSRAV